jgi:hypothetical protein
MSKGARVRAGRTRAGTMEHRAAVRQAYQDERSQAPSVWLARLLKFGENRHERRKEAARARRQHKH